MSTRRSRLRDVAPDDGGTNRPNEEKDEERVATAPAPPDLPEDVRAKLEQLERLHERGVLTDEEFASQRGRLLAPCTRSRHRG